MSKQKMTVSRHLKNAFDLAMAKMYLDKVVSRCEKCFAKSTTLMKNVNRVNPSKKGGYFATIIKELNEDFFSVTDAAEHDKYGEIYSRLTEIAKQKSNKPIRKESKLFIIGRHVKLKDIPDCDAWEFVSAALFEEEAIKQCCSDKYFYVPVYIKKEDREGQNVLIEAVYPKKKNKKNDK